MYKLKDKTILSTENEREITIFTHHHKLKTIKTKHLNESNVRILCCTSKGDIMLLEYSPTTHLDKNSKIPHAKMVSQTSLMFPCRDIFFITLSTKETGSHDFVCVIDHLGNLRFLMLSNLRIIKGLIFPKMKKVLRIELEGNLIHLFGNNKEESEGSLEEEGTETWIGSFEENKLVFALVSQEDL